MIISAYWRGLSNRPARFCWRFVAQRGMRPDVVVVVSPDGQLALGIGQAVEYLFVVAFVAQAAVEALDECVLLRFAWIDVVPLDHVVVCPFQDRFAGEVKAPYTDDADQGITL